MILLHPIWLLLIIPLGVSLMIWKMPTRLLTTLRAMALVLILLAMAGLAVQLPSRAGTVVIVADRSFSMPTEAMTRQKEIIENLQAAQGDHDKLAVVSFGQRVAIEQPPSDIKVKFQSFKSVVGRNASDLEKAMQTALSMIPTQTPGRILMVTDGRWTGQDPVEVVAKAAARGVAIDYRQMSRPTTNDLAIEQINAPAQVNPGEAFMLHAYIKNPQPGEIKYQLLRNGIVIAKGTRQGDRGRVRLTFRDHAAKPGTHQYNLLVTGAEKDPVPENNSARVLVGIEGQKPMLLVSSRPNTGLGQLLQAGQVDLQITDPAQSRWSIEDLSNYSAILLENVPARHIGNESMENLAAWVTSTGGGLMMTGGQRSFGTGGYFKSPLDPILPVSMELRNDRRKFKVAIVVVLDRSGSMSMPVPGGKSKMDLANMGTMEVVKMLGPMDEIGVIAVDSTPHTIVNLTKITNPASINSKISGIQSMGGGIFVYEGLKAASSMIASADAGTKHIILFSDAADSEQPGKYRQLLKKCSNAGITCSVIGLGTKADPDAKFLEDVAKRGQGNIYFTEDAKQLPRLFAEDTIVMSRRAFLEENTITRSTADLYPIIGKALNYQQTVGGYNLCYLKPKASMGALTLDEYKAPIIASWQSGIGRVMTYTGEADGKYTGPIKNWENVGQLFASMARWTMGGQDDLPDNMLLRQRVTNGIAKITLDLDPNRTRDPFDKLPIVTILRGETGFKPLQLQTPMRWASADTLEVSVPLLGNETAISTVNIDQSTSVTLPPVCLPYSPEYQPSNKDKGPATLKRMANATGGKQRDILHDIWKDLPKHARMVDLSPWLIFAALTMLLVEVLERRSGLISAWGTIKIKREKTEPVAKQIKQHGQTKPKSRQSIQVKNTTPVPEKTESTTSSAETKSKIFKSKAKKETSEESESMFDAMKKAQLRAKKRNTGKDD